MIQSSPIGVFILVRNVTVVLVILFLFWVGVCLRSIDNLFLLLLFGCEFVALELVFLLFIGFILFFKNWKYIL